jgi:LemA protein
VENAWSQIDVQLKKRYDLVPNLVETVKGYAKQEKTVFEEVTKARAAIMKAGNVTETAEANNMLTGALKSLFAVAENYPQLKSSQNFLALQEELSGIEGKIAATRQFYNDAVLDYDNAIEQFPGNVMAGIFGFKEKPYFEIEEAARQNVKVSF